LFSKRAFSLPQFGLLLLCAAWLLPGLVGHAPWKGGDGEHFVQLWLLLQSDVAPQAASATPPLYYWVAMATAWLTSPILDLADGARLASGLFIALALFFVARTARVLYGAEAGWAAALILLGCLGLLVRGHELNAATAQFAAATVMLYGIASLPQDTRSRWVLGGGTALMLLAGGAAEALLFLTLAALLPLLPAKQRETHPNDWMTTDAEVACPDPYCGGRFRITRIGKRIFRHSEVTLVPLDPPGFRAEPA